MTHPLTVTFLVMVCFAESRAAVEPRLLSVFPPAAQRGTKIQVELRGNELDGVYALWPEEGGLTATVRDVKLLAEAEAGAAGSNASNAKKKPPVYQAVLDLEVSSPARTGVHWLRVVTPRGASNALRFLVTAGPVVLEQSERHGSAREAQVVRLPSLVAGRLSRPGEVDLYSFHAEEGQELRFRVKMADSFEPRLALFRDQPSWFGSDRNPRVLFQEEGATDLMPVDAHGTFRAAQSGRYFLEVSSLFGKGSPDCTYELVAVTGDARLSEGLDGREAGWSERSFLRPLGEGWMAAVAARSGVSGGKTLTRATDQEHNQRTLTIPALIEGTIGHPGEVGTFRFRVEAGQKLAFEVETPRTPPPHFNPRLSVVDERGHQLFANLQHRISLFNNNAEPEAYLKALEPKAVYTFPSVGEYVLQVRDITARYGNESYAYRILIRPQAPHVGEVSSPDLEQVNLARGAAKKITLTTFLEEGFSGEVVFSLAGLPAGVTAYPGGRVVEERAPLDLPENAEPVLPVSYSSTVILLAATGAELSRTPALVRLHCRAIVNGVPGPDLLVKEFPMMLVEASKVEEKQK